MVKYVVKGINQSLTALLNTFEIGRPKINFNPIKVNFHEHDVPIHVKITIHRR